MTINKRSQSTDLIIKNALYDVFFAKQDLVSLRDGPYLRKYHALFPNTVIICLKQLLRDTLVRLLRDTVVRLLTDTVVRRR